MEKTPAIQQRKNIVEWIRQYFLELKPDAKAVIGISGGKDSSVAAALCVEALGADRVYGVLMPHGCQKDLNDSLTLVEALGINYSIVNIYGAMVGLYDALVKVGIDHLNPRILTNTPARMRMTTLYAVAASVGGRVVNTCNRSEDYIGYSTKFGDAAGDFSILSDYCVREVIAIGDTFTNLPYELVHKVPDDGMAGKSDEDNLGFSYEVLDSYLLDGVLPDPETLEKIEQLHLNNLHKLELMPFCPKI